MRRKSLHLFALTALLALEMPLSVAAQEVIKIGLVMPMTGVLGPVGKQAVAGARLYMSQHGDTVAGRKIELIVRDDASVPDNSKRIGSGSRTMIDGSLSSLYEGLACQEVFSRSTFLLFRFSRGLARAQFYIDGTASPLLGRAERSTPGARRVAPEGARG
jgi:Periplasmic binding protein